ncbi:MAG: hypothetical protein JWR63_2279 [Conexibacter sp.]|nr:hypothetical protein [Conexibacter sp.]
MAAMPHPAHSTPEPRRVYRSAGTSVMLAVGGMILMIILAFAVYTARHEPAVFFLVAIYGPVALFFTFRLPRCGVYIEDDGIRILNVFTSTRLRWNEIAGFEVRSYGLARVTRVRGPAVAVFGIQQSALVAWRRLRDTEETRMIDDLNALVESRRLRRDQRPAVAITPEAGHSFAV